VVVLLKVLSDERGGQTSQWHHVFAQVLGDDTGKKTNNKERLISCFIHMNFKYCNINVILVQNGNTALATYTH
jgi:hypothetical protein